jgi:hypothetical protein
MNNLKDELIKLGSDDPGLRKHIRPILNRVTDKSSNTRKSAGGFQSLGKRHDIYGIISDMDKGDFLVCKGGSTDKYENITLKLVDPDGLKQFQMVSDPSDEWDGNDVYEIFKYGSVKIVPKEQFSG